MSSLFNERRKDTGMVILTEEMKLEAVVVTVVRVEDEEYLRAFDKNVHITALQVKSSPPQSRRRGMCS